MSAHTESPRTVRIVGGLLALIWLGAGITAIVVGVTMSRWLLVASGVAASCYGVLWVRVVQLGRRLTVRDALMPWRVGQRYDA